MATTALAPPIRLPFRQFLTERTLRRRALALPLPASIPGYLLRKERCGGRRLRPCAKDGTAAPGEKSTFPFAKPSLQKTELRFRRKTYLVTRHPPQTIKKQAADSGEKRSSPLPDGRHKKQKNRTPDLDVLQVWMRQQPNLPWGDPKVLSAQESLTSVFGMRTGGSSPLSSPQWLYNPRALARGFIYKL